MSAYSLDQARAALASASTFDQIRQIVTNTSVNISGVNGNPLTLFYSGTIGAPPNDVPAYKIVDGIAESLNGHLPGEDDDSRENGGHNYLR